MENMNKKDKLEAILKDIKEAIDLYNNLNPSEKLSLTASEPKIDVSDLFICVYDDFKIGLFRKIDYFGNETWTQNGAAWDAGTVYVGIGSSYIGMKKTHTWRTYQSYWERSGLVINLRSGRYMCNCNMSREISFDDLRLKMFCDGQCGPYEIGKASNIEILEVLRYASCYYQLDKNTKILKTI